MKRFIFSVTLILMFLSFPISSINSINPLGFGSFVGSLVGSNAAYAKFREGTLAYNNMSVRRINASI